MALKILPSVFKLLSSIEASLEPIDEFTLASRLRQSVGDDITPTEDERRGCMAEIVGLEFLTIDSDDREPWNSYFGPMSIMKSKDGTEVCIPDATKFDAEIIQYWIKRSETTPHPTLKSRYADLAWEIGHIWNRNHSDEKLNLHKTIVEQAIKAYLEAVNKGITESEYQAWRFLDRATELALKIKDTPLVELLKNAIFDFHRQQASMDKSIFWWKLDDLALRHKGLNLSAPEQQEIIASLQEALMRHSNIENREKFHPHHALDASSRLARRFSKLNQREDAINAVRIAGTSFETMAQEANGLLAITWLEDLLIRYHNLGMKQDVARVEAAIRSRSIEAEKAMKHIEILDQTSQEEFEKLLELLNKGTLDQALANIGFHLMTKVNTLRGNVEKIAVNAPLYAHLSTNIMGTDGFTVAKVGSISDDPEGHMLRQAAYLLKMNTSLLCAALDRAKVKHNFDIDKLFSYLIKTPYFSPTTHSLLKEGIAAWFSRDFVKSIHILVPQVEAALRKIMMLLGDLVMKSNKSEGFDVIGMGGVLRSDVFKTKFDQTSRWHLLALYSDHRGINLRNNLAHGLAGTELLGEGIATWVIHSLLMIGSLIPLSENPER